MDSYGTHSHTENEGHSCTLHSVHISLYYKQDIHHWRIHLGTARLQKSEEYACIEDSQSFLFLMGAQIAQIGKPRRSKRDQARKGVYCSGLLSHSHMTVQWPPKCPFEIQTLLQRSLKQSGCCLLKSIPPAAGAAGLVSTGTAHVGRVRPRRANVATKRMTLQLENILDYCDTIRRVVVVSAGVVLVYLFLLWEAVMRRKR